MILGRLFQKKEETGDMKTTPAAEEIQKSTVKTKEKRKVGQYIYGTCQSVGRQREHNEDALFAMSSIMREGETEFPFGLFIVADGMGGHQHGEVASGAAIRALTMEERMTVCNMSIEAGARAGLIAPDETTFAYLKDKPRAPKGAAWEKAVAYWRTLPSDPDAAYDKEIKIDARLIVPMVTWGTSPEDVAPITGVVPDPASANDEGKRKAMQRALDYMGLKPGMKLTDVKIDKVFIGSCTNGRIEDLRAAAAVAKGRHVAPHVVAMVVPGSGLVKQQAEKEGLDRIFRDAGFDWREPGCSMCLAMNEDRLKPGERCASTSNRNFEGRQGRDSRTHLMSPAMAAAAAIAGKLTDVRGMG